MKEAAIIAETKAAIQTIRGEHVITDADLAEIYNVKTKVLNQAVKRNIKKFPDDFMFQLNEEEWNNLKSQTVTSSEGKWGGRRTPPYVFTEHGELQVANVINSDLANSISVFVIRAFIDMRAVIALQDQVLKSQNATSKNAGEEKLGKFLGEIGPKLQRAVNRVMDTVIDVNRGTTVREEGQDIISESILSLKERLKKTGLENEEIAARITKLLAEAEKDRAQARKTSAETEQLEFLTMVRKLKLVLEAQKLLQVGSVDETEMKRIDAFIHLLKEQQL